MILTCVYSAIPLKRGIVNLKRWASRAFALVLMLDLRLRSGLPCWRWLALISTSNQGMVNPCLFLQRFEFTPNLTMCQDPIPQDSISDVGLLLRYGRSHDQTFKLTPHIPWREVAVMVGARQFVKTSPLRELQPHRSRKANSILEVQYRGSAVSQHSVHGRSLPYNPDLRIAGLSGMHALLMKS